MITKTIQFKFTTFLKMQLILFAIALKLISVTAGQQKLIENIYYQDFSEWKVKYCLIKVLNQLSNLTIYRMFVIRRMTQTIKKIVHLRTFTRIRKILTSIM